MVIAQVCQPLADRRRLGIELAGEVEHLLAGHFIVAELRRPADLNVLEILHAVNLPG
jgi:hypothetical protein